MHSRSNQSENNTALVGWEGTAGGPGKAIWESRMGYPQDIFGSCFANILICLRDETLMPLLRRQLNHIAAARKWRRLTQALQTKDNYKRFSESSFNYQQLRSAVHQIQLTGSTSGYLKKNTSLLPTVNTWSHLTTKKRLAWVLFVLDNPSSGISSPKWTVESNGL